MKKYLFVALASISLMACEEDKDDTNQNANTYPTDNLTLKAEVQPLLIQAYGHGEPTQPVYEIARLMMKTEIESFATISTSTADGYAFQTEFGKNLLFNFDAGVTAPAYIVGEAPLDMPQDLYTALPMFAEELNDKKPLLSLAHEVTNSDTAWTVDVKVKMLRDTVAPNLHVQTYLLGDVPAIKYDALDLRMSQVPGFIIKGDSTSYWEKDVLGADSATVVAEAGALYQHPDVLIGTPANDKSAWGLSLESYWSFGAGFNNNDVLGTRYTPIRHNFNKEEVYDMVDFQFTPKVMTVFWVQNPQTASFEYVNSVTTELEMDPIPVE